MVLFAVFGLLAVFAVTRAEGKWKIWNLLIILASCLIGFFVAYLAGAWSRNMALGGEIAIPTTLAFGSLGAVFGRRRKKSAAKAESGS
jgi:hypothetical protein